MKKTKSKKAVTLIALVTTIVVLIILTSISIAFVIGKNSIVEKAHEGKEKYAKVDNIEEIKRQVNAIVIEGLQQKMSKEQIDAKIDEYLNTTSIKDDQQLKDEIKKDADVEEIINARSLKPNDGPWKEDEDTSSTTPEEETPQTIATDMTFRYVIKKDIAQDQPRTLLTPKFTNIPEGCYIEVIQRKTLFSKKPEIKQLKTKAEIEGYTCNIGQSRAGDTIIYKIHGDFKRANATIESVSTHTKEIEQDEAEIFLDNWGENNLNNLKITAKYWSKTYGGERFFPLTTLQAPSNAAKGFKNLNVLFIQGEPGKTVFYFNQNSYPNIHKYFYDVIFR